MPVELAVDLVALALYDIVIYADDSTSMKYAENGSRIDDMKVVLERVTEVATLFDADGMKLLSLTVGLSAPQSTLHPQRSCVVMPCTVCQGGCTAHGSTPLITWRCIHSSDE